MNNVAVNIHEYVFTWVLFSLLMLNFSLGISCFMHFSLAQENSSWDGAVCTKGGKPSLGGMQAVLGFWGPILSSEVILSCILFTLTNQQERKDIMHFHDEIFPDFELFPSIKCEVWIVLF